MDNKKSDGKKSDGKKSKNFKNVIKLYHTYQVGYQFPPWVAYFVYSNQYDNFANKTLVFYDSPTTSLSIAMELALKREPVNITMTRHYDEAKMMENFGWKQGAYARIVKKDNKIHNIAIYCYTPYLKNTHKINVDSSLSDFKKLKSVNIHIINSVGLALDSPHQPDHKLLVKNNVINKPLYTIELKKILNKIVACFKYLRSVKKIPLKEILFTGVGMSAFSGGYLVQDIFMKVFLDILQENREYREKHKVGFHYLSFRYSNPQIKSVYEMDGLESEYGKEIIGDITTYPFLKTTNTSEILFVNAWDPWSLPGNGNFRDQSLDGYVGRRSAISCLCWPQTNSYMTKKKYIGVP